MLGSDPGDDKEIRILSRKVVWGDQIITYEADGRNVKSILKSMGLDAKSNGLDAFIVAETPREAAIEEVELGPVEAKEFRRIAALANHVAMEWPDIQASCARKCPSPPRRAGRSSSELPGTSRSTRSSGMSTARGTARRSWC